MAGLATVTADGQDMAHGLGMRAGRDLVTVGEHDRAVTVAAHGLAAVAGRTSAAVEVDSTAAAAVATRVAGDMVAAVTGKSFA